MLKRIMLKKMIPVCCGVFAIACGSANQHNPSTADMASVHEADSSSEDTDEPAPDDQTAPDDDAISYPPMDFVLENIRTTHFSAHVVITDVAVDDPRPGGGYVNHVYTASVIDCVYGNVPETVRYSVMAERDISPRKIGTEQFVSLCRSGDGLSAYSPDNGYTFDVDPSFSKKCLVISVSATVQNAEACQ